MCSCTFLPALSHRMSTICTCLVSVLGCAWGARIAYFEDTTGLMYVSICISYISVYHRNLRTRQARRIARTDKTATYTIVNIKEEHRLLRTRVLSWCSLSAAAAVAASRGVVAGSAHCAGTQLFDREWRVLAPSCCWRLYRLWCHAYIYTALYSECNCVYVYSGHELR